MTSSISRVARGRNFDLQLGLQVLWCRGGENERLCPSWVEGPQERIIGGERIPRRVRIPSIVPSTKI